MVLTPYRPFPLPPVREVDGQDIFPWSHSVVALAVNLAVSYTSNSFGKATRLGALVLLPTLRGGSGVGATGGRCTVGSARHYVCEGIAVSLVAYWPCGGNLGLGSAHCFALSL